MTTQEYIQSMQTDTLTAFIRYLTDSDPKKLKAWLTAPVSEELVKKIAKEYENIEKENRHA